MEKKYLKYILFFLFLTYFIFSQHYYYTQEHLFDPFLQTPTPRFEDDITKVKNGNKKVFRILTLGGSTTLNANLSKNERYVNIMRRILQNKYPGVKIEIFNGANNWYTTKHSLINYVTYYRDWYPDLVIIMHAMNDLYRSFSPEFFAIGDYNDLWTHFYGPSITGAHPFTFEEYIIRKYFLRVFKIFIKFRSKPVDYPLERYISINAFKMNLRKLIEYIKNDNAEIMLINQPCLLKPVMKDSEIDVLWLGIACCSTKDSFFTRKYASAKSLCNAMNMFNDVIKEVALSEKVLFVDAEGQISKDLENFVDDIHYTELGAKTLAHIVAERIIGADIVK